MKKLIACALLLVGLASCAPRYKYAADYDIGITRTAVAGVVTQGAKGMSYRDDLIEASFNQLRDGLALKVMNRSPNSLKVIWDETVLISPLLNKAMKVFISNTRIINKDQPQAPSLIPPGGNISETIYPSELTYFRRAGQMSDWVTGDLVPGMYLRSTPEQYPEFKAAVEGLNGRRLPSLLLTIDNAGQKVEYLFDFQIKGVSIREIDEPVPLNLGPQFN